MGLPGLPVCQLLAPRLLLEVPDTKRYVEDVCVLQQKIKKINKRREIRRTKEEMDYWVIQAWIYVYKFLTILCDG